MTLLVPKLSTFLLKDGGVNGHHANNVFQADFFLLFLRLAVLCI